MLQEMNKLNNQESMLTNHKDVLTKKLSEHKKLKMDKSHLETLQPN